MPVQSWATQNASLKVMSLIKVTCDSGLNQRWFSEVLERRNSPVFALSCILLGGENRLTRWLFRTPEQCGELVVECLVMLGGLG